MNENESSDSLSEFRLPGEAKGDLGDFGASGRSLANLALSLGDEGPVV